MKNFYLLLVLLIASSSYAQFQIDFDSFTTGDISGQSTYIIPWPGATSSPQVTSTQAFSLSNSMQVRNNVTDDVVFQLGNKTSGIWIAEFMMYVPTNSVGYWNIQENENTLPNQWNADFYVGATSSGGSTGVITHDQSTTTVSYPSGSWFLVEMSIDLNNSTLSTVIDGSMFLNKILYPGNQFGGINFYSIDSSNNYYIDDFKFYEGCYTPSNLTLDNTTNVTADFSWNIVSTETGGYNYLVMPSGDNPETDTPVDSGTTAPGASSLQVVSLTPLTDYDIYLQSSCDNSMLSEWTSVLSFTTSATCNSPIITTYPYLEDFENDSPSLGCWSQINEVGSSDWTFNEGSTSGNIASAVSGVQNIVFVSESSVADPVTKFVSPVFDLSSLSNPSLKFFYAQEDYIGDYNSLKVYYRVSDQDPWMELNHYNLSQNTWEQVYLALPNPSSTYQIAFEGINNFGRPNVIDDVEVYESLSVHSQNFEGFTYYPNPTKNVMSFSAKSEIQEIKIYDILGKKVAEVRPNQRECDISLSSLLEGVYFVKAKTHNSIKSFKIIKE